ncbi:MAG: acetylglutamate kinase [Clostridia bacterium]|nr:acetylglutamate kinase [Clostridia bacterium]
MEKLLNSQRAEVLVHALPYIRQYSGKTVVVKYGGSAMTSETLSDQVMGDLVLLSLVGAKVVLIHGGGPEISGMLKKLGKETDFVNGLRVTDGETADVVQMVLAGKINKNLVKSLQLKGATAIGLSGIDGKMLEAKKLDERLGFVGEIVNTDTTLIKDMLDRNYIPVISTIGFDKDGNSYNINADTAAAYIAGSLKAECLISMTDIDGIMRDKDDASTLIKVIKVSDAPGLISDGIIQGGMIPKTECCVKAIECGVRKVFIINGKIPHSIILELLTDEGIGTMFVE